MKQLFFAFSLCSFCLLGCRTESQSENLDSRPRDYSDRFTLVPTDTLIIPISEKTDIYSRYIQAVEVGGEAYLAMVNEKTNEVEFYGLEDSDHYFSIHIEDEEMYPIASLRAFHLYPDSTLLVAGSYRRAAYLVDFLGNVQATYKTMVDRPDGEYVPMYYGQIPLIAYPDGQHFLISTKVDTDYFLPGIWSGTMFLKVKKDSPTYQHVFPLPEFFSKLVYGARFSHSSHALVGNKYLAISLPFYNDLLYFDIETDELSQRNAGSTYFGDALPWERPEPNRDEAYYVEADSYRDIIYDPVGKFLYRIAYRGVGFLDADGNQRDWNNKIPSVIILDESLEKVGELDLPVNTYYTRSLFPYKGKLYISLNHPDNNPNEDKLMFVGFKPITR